MDIDSFSKEEQELFKKLRSLKKFPENLFKISIDKQADVVKKKKELENAESSEERAIREFREAIITSFKISKINCPHPKEFMEEDEVHETQSLVCLLCDSKFKRKN